MFRKIVAFLLISILFPFNSAWAEDVKITQTKIVIQTPCNYLGFMSFKSCVIVDTTFEAPAPRDDITLSQKPFMMVQGKGDKVAYIHRFHTSTHYINYQGVVSLWDSRNRFIAQWRTSQTRETMMYYTSANGGYQWSAPRAGPNSPISFTIQY